MYLKGNWKTENPNFIPKGKRLVIKKEKGK